MKKFITLLVGLVFTLFVTGQETTHELEDFDELKVYNGLSVLLKKANTNKAVIKGKNSQEISFKIEEGQLKIRKDIDKLFKDEDIQIVLYYVKITKIEVLQNAGVKFSQKFKQKDLHLEAQEGAEIIANVEVENLKCKTITGGEIDISGKAIHQEINVRAGGKYYAKNLKSDFTDISINAGGVADIFAREKVIAKVKAGGTVNIYGNPKTLDKNTLFGGKIVRKN